jgi:hypothetical protein
MTKRSHVRDFIYFIVVVGSHFVELTRAGLSRAELKFPSYTPPEPATPTIVHLSIRSFVPQDTSLKKKRRNRSGDDPNQAGTSQDEHGTGCCCVIC